MIFLTGRFKSSNNNTPFCGNSGMPTNIEHTEHQAEIRRYKVQYPISAYTFPREARIQSVRFDEEFMHLELTDGRVLSVPLRWIPTLQNAPAAEREKYELDHTRTMLIWDPGKCAINDEVRLADYLNPGESCDRDLRRKDV